MACVGAFYFRASPYGSVSCGHNDQNCFVLTAWGEPLAIPTRYYDFYGSHNHDRWTRAARAKCGIICDRETGQICGPEAASKVLAYRVERDGAVFTGDATATYGGKLTRAMRDMVRVGRDVFVLRDNLAGAEPHAFTYWLHETDRMAVEETGNHVEIRRPKAVLDVQFLAPAKLSFAQTSSFDPEPVECRDGKRILWHLATTTEKTTSATILSVLIARRADDPSVWSAVRGPATSNGDETVLITSQERSYSVVFPKSSALYVR